MRTAQSNLFFMDMIKKKYHQPDINYLFLKQPLPKPFKQPVSAFTVKLH